MGNIEIERRFLLCNDSWRKSVCETLLLQQGYLSVEKDRTIRVRISGNRAWLTLKGHLSAISRHEFEYEIPLSDAQTMLASMCPFKVEKQRHIVDYQGFTFEIDEFFGENAPLILCELELLSETAEYPRPDWLGEEITSDGRFSNAYLSKHPFSTWK